MSEKTIKMPDIGEGITESEISEWLVAPGDLVAEDDLLVVVMTDKAAVEIPSSVSGKVTWLAADAGDVLPVGAPLLKINVSDESGGDDAGKYAEAVAEETVAEPEEDVADKPQEEAAEDAVEKETETAPKPEEDTKQQPEPERAEDPPGKARASETAKTLAAPAVRQRAADLGLDLAQLSGSGPDGRVTHADLDRHLVEQSPAARSTTDGDFTETNVIGLRRKIAEQMTRAHTSIPAITIVEEVDVTELERLRAQMNETRRKGRAKLTLLPFLIRAMDMSRAVAPMVNARYDEAEGVLRQFAKTHIGVATQTDSGLMVPVMKNVADLSMWDMAAEITRLAEAARAGKLSRQELSGSTMTITSLGALGAIASTPIINHPEVAIVGVNRKAIRPLWDGSRFAPREMMNLSASFDHRIVDGWDAAQFIALMKDLLETPALLFVASENE